MKYSSRVTIIGLMGFWVLVLAPNSWAQQRAPILDQVAKTYGVDSWDKVEAIRYTWNGEITGLFKISHKWEWEPKTNKVSYEGVDKDGKPVTATYVRTDLGSQSDAVKTKLIRLSLTITIGFCSLSMLIGTRAPARSIRASLTCQWAPAWPSWFR